MEQSADIKKFTHRYTLSLTARKALFITAALFCLTPWVSPSISLALGMVLALTHENPFHALSRRTAKHLLQLSVILLGFGMNLPDLLRAGRNGQLFALCCITLTFLLRAFLGRALHIPSKLAVLISAGTAICGGSAIAAVGAVINAGEGEMTIAIGTVFLLNAVALYLFPVLGHALHLNQTQFGTWAGVAIHDISSVVGAASRYGPRALQTAAAVKLSRTLWIIPVSFAAAFLFKAPVKIPQYGEADSSKGSIKIPWFVGIFFLASLARSYVPVVQSIAPFLTALATIGFTLTLFLIGSGISWKTLKAVGWRPLVQGLILWTVISVGSLMVVLRMHG